MHPLLKQFYQDINAWVEQGCPTHPAFVINCGLCRNLGNYLGQLNLNQKEKINVYMELSKQFIDAQLDNQYPFDNGDMDYKHKPKFTNPRRLRWIIQHAGE